MAWVAKANVYKVSKKLFGLISRNSFCLEAAIVLYFLKYCLTDYLYTNTFCNLQIYYLIGRNTFDKLEKYILPFGET